MENVREDAREEETREEEAREVIKNLWQCKNENTIIEYGLKNVVIKTLC